jgi:hypothetical protein
MQISEGLVSSWLALTAVRRSPMIINVRMFFNDNWKDPLIDVTSWEICFTEIRMFVGIVKFKVQ